MDTYFAWRQRNAKGGDFPPVVVRVTNGTGVQVNVQSKYECAVQWSAEDVAIHAPSGPFSIPGPAWSKFHAEVNINVQTNKTVRVRFHGDTYMFRSNFNDLGIPGRYEDLEGNVLCDTATDKEKREGLYVRVIKSWDVSMDDHKNHLLRMFQDSLYEHTLVQVTWAGVVEEATPVATLKKELEALKNVGMYEM
jgi:hypothetical protein